MKNQTQTKAEEEEAEAAHMNNLFNMLEGFESKTVWEINTKIDSTSS